MLDQYAYLWGMKAARAGLTISANPYRTQNLRAAWVSGFSSEILKLADIMASRAPAPEPLAH